jgi:hypothetical protein
VRPRVRATNATRALRLADGIVDREHELFAAALDQPGAYADTRRQAQIGAPIAAV